MSRRAGVRHDLSLFWVSGLSLFFEILLIRWLSAEIRIFAYFHNLVLLFCFLGIGLGCAQPDRKPGMLQAFTVLGIFVLLITLDPFLGLFAIRNASVYLSLGADFLMWHPLGSTRWDAKLIALLAGSGMLLGCMLLLTLFFIPFGRWMGRLFQESRRPLRAYGINVLGSLIGVWLFAVLSAWSLPPAVWFLVGGLGSLPLLQTRRQQVLAGVLTLCLSAAVWERHAPGAHTVWSPYQKLTALPLRVKVDGRPVEYGYKVLVNMTQYMLMTNYTPGFMQRYPALYPPHEVPYDHYNIPYRFTEHVADVLIVGSGAGNDVAGALRNGAGHVTAVDIDPVIIQFGRALHPEAPYQDPRVRVVNDDARSFFKQDARRYDLIVFGLLDSHTLSSSYSNVRLDNYVYTVESFREARRLLKPHGVLVMLFEVTDDFIGARLQRILTEAFGRPPVGFDVRSGFRGWGGYGFVTGDVGVIERRLSADQRLQEVVAHSRAVFERWAAAPVSVATDNWPYLYLRDKGIPKLYGLIFGLLLLFASLGIRRMVGGMRFFQWRFFFLGAGFLLLEVQNISKSALLFGTTWTVNTVVISAVLAMILAANYLVTRWPPRSLTPYYVGLFLALASNLFVPLDLFVQMPPVIKPVAAGVFMSLPMLFAGVIFSALFAITADRAGAIASNLIGAMVGGMAECLSFIIGIRALLILAAVLYLCAVLLRRRPHAHAGT